MISFDNVSKFILSNINIHIPKGSVVGLVGASGAGKTTFLRLACGFLQADVGKVYIDGNEQKSFIVDKTGKIGALFADRPLFSDSESVCSNFEALRIAHGISKWEFEYRYFKLASELGFDKFDGQKISSLSLEDLYILKAATKRDKEAITMDELNEAMIKDLSKKVENSNAYHLSGTLEIYRNEEKYTYSVDSSYKKDDLFKVNLVNQNRDGAAKIEPNEY